ncbi:GNAT family N-acetyltransferase [Nocardioides sp. GXQ0305]|uniref:GNAT family N-acetyltransferase n=1 Tax=Nocardioides sp. GXQ0305 TaxID=3423912 RepID=UPI003D7D9E82
MTSADAVRERYREIHGDVPTSPADDRVLARGHEPVTDEQVLADMAAGRLPMPPYLLSDGTPVAPSHHLDPVAWAGGAEGLHDWFVRYWPEDRRAEADQAFDDWMAGRFAHLDPATPRTMRRVERLQKQALEAVARLEADPRDPVGRGSLAEATDTLDGLLLPSTDVDRARHGGTTPREEWVDRLRRDHLTVPPPELPIRTERLVLRSHTADDTDDLYAFYGREDVATYLLQDPYPRAELDDRVREWDSSDDDFGVVIELDGRVVGDVVLMFRGPSQAELGWVVHPDVGGRGIATEAARALIDVGFRHYGFHRIYAELDARNTASARLCERLGMRLETHRLQDIWSKGEWTDTLQYAVLAPEWEAAAQG